MNKSKFIVTGCSRSGTAYTAKLFSSLGIPCGHEKVFNIYNVKNTEEAANNFAMFPQFRGESSFLSVPFLKTLPTDIIVLHQVRHPVSVIRSHMGIRFFSQKYQPSIYLADNHTDFLDFIRSHCPEIFAHTEEIKRTMQYWVSWNGAVELVSELRHLRYFRYRIEALDRTLLNSFLESLGVHINKSAINSALASVSDRTNTRPRDTHISWSVLPNGQLKDEIEELASKYGYANLSVN